jgi:hypothetical protein
MIVVLCQKDTIDWMYEVCSVMPKQPWVENKLGLRTMFVVSDRVLNGTHSTDDS